MKFFSRSGLLLLSRYIQTIGITSLLADRFSFLKKNRKGTPLWSIFHQLILFFIDGTDPRMRYLDHLKKDPSYSGTIETDEKEMLSSHSARRFFGSITHVFSSIKHFSYFLRRSDGLPSGPKGRYNVEVTRRLRTDRKEELARLLCMQQPRQRNGRRGSICYTTIWFRDLLLLHAPVLQHPFIYGAVERRPLALCRLVVRRMVHGVPTVVPEIGEDGQFRRILWIIGIGHFDKAN